MTHEAEFGFRVRQALNDSTDRLGLRAQMRLAEARRAALAAIPDGAGVAAGRPLALVSGHATAPDPAGGWLWRTGLVAPLLALAIGLFAIPYWQHARQIEELAALDFAVLLDAAPLEVYADRGFTTLLQLEHDQR